MMAICMEIDVDPSNVLGWWDYPEIVVISLPRVLYIFFEILSVIIRFCLNPHYNVHSNQRLRMCQ